MSRRLDGLAALSVVAILVGISGTTEAGELNCRIPFSFTANGKVLPAGDYHVSTTRDVLFVRGFGGGALVMTNGLATENETQGKLVFQRDGSEYVLMQVWMGRSNGREVIQPRVDRERIKTARSDKTFRNVEQVIIPAS